MSATSLDYKGHIPYLPSAIERPQLVAKLSAASQHRVTIISAPPGYGKTTLAAQFANQTSSSIIWHTVEERQRDFSNLYNHSLSMLEPLMEGISSRLPYTDNVPASETAVNIADYLRESQIDDLVYIFDDVHHLDGAAQCESWLKTLFKRLPKSCHIILISRTLPNLPYADLTARNDILAMGQNDLRLTEVEVHLLAEKLLKEPVSASTMRVLSERLDGWPAGVFLALQPLPTNLTDIVFSGDNASEALFTEIAHQMLLAQTPELRDFLLGSSTLSYLTIELCETVLQLPHSADWLAVAQAHNLFLTSMTRGLEYHSLFRVFLQHKLHSENPDRFISLHLKAALWFEEQDDLEEAFKHFMAAGKWEEARILADRAAIAYFGQGKFETMLDWSAQLSKAGILASNLSIECSMIHTDRYEYDKAEHELNRAERGFRQVADRAGLARVTLQRAWIHCQRGDYDKAFELAREFVDLDIDTLRGRALRIIGLAHLRRGDVPTSIMYLEEAAKLYRNAGLVSSLSHLLHDLQFAYMRVGRLDDMGRCLQEVVAIRRNLGGASGQALALNPLGYYYHRRSNYKEAWATFTEGLRLVSDSGDSRTEGYLLASFGDLNRDLGHYNTAQELYNRAFRIVGTTTEPSLQNAILISISTLLRWTAKPSEAVLVAEEALKVAQTHKIAFEATMADIAIWLARAEVADPCQSLDHLKIAIQDLQRQEARFEMLEVLGGCVHMAALCGDNNTAQEYLRLAFRLTKEVGTAQAMAAEMIHHSSLEHLFIEMPGSSQLIADLKKLHEARSKLDKDESTGQFVHPSAHILRILTLGHEKIKRDGKLISIAEWQAAAPRELFFYLMFNGPRTRADIEMVFWPEGSDHLKGLFHTTLHRARQALGPRVILFEDETYLINPDLNIECDAYQLASWTTQAKLLPPQDARAENLWQKAVSLFKGNFLPTLNANWVVARQEAYRSMYLDALIGLGQCASIRNDFEAAIDWLSTALATDPYSEKVYRRMIQYYAKMGESGKARSCYQQMETILRDDLGIGPSEETKRLFQSIVDTL